MSTRVISMLLLIAVVVSVGLFHVKHKEEIHNLDKVALALTGLKAILPPKTVVYVEYEIVGVEVFQQARNILVPVQLIRANGNLKDTMLDINFSKDNFQDSLWKSRGYQLVWQHHGTAYIYSYLLHQH